MSKSGLYSILILLFASFTNAMTIELHTTSWCKYCPKAKAAIKELITEGYDIKIIEPGTTKSFPTLIIKTKNSVKELVGLKTKKQYKDAIDGQKELDSRSDKTSRSINKEGKSQENDSESILQSRKFIKH